MEIVKKQLFESLTKSSSNGFDVSFVELTTKQKYRIIKKGKEDELVKFSFTEFFNWLPSKHYSELFIGLKDNKLAPLIEDDLLTPFDQATSGDIIDESAIKNHEKVILNSLKTFSGILKIINEFLSTIDKPVQNNKNQQQPQPQQQLPIELLEILKTIHEIILQFLNISEKIEQEKIYSKELSKKLSGVYSDLSNEISQCCEIWIRQKRTEFQELVPQTISYLLTKSASSGVIADISRLNKVRHGLLTLEYTDPNARSFIDLLLNCFIHPQFIKTDEGKKFLIFIFSIRSILIEEIHQTVKGQLLHANKTTRDSYAEIYFKAWKIAQGPFLVKIEYYCIQNLMEVAIHCSNQKLSKNLNAFLHYFHNQKPYKEVDPMLYRLYEPILFRSLSVSHPLVRTNAARLFYDSFPLKKSNEDNQEDIDSELSRQFKLLKDLFEDPSIQVRVVAIEGTFEVLSKFWELIPLSNSRSLLSKLINELAFDKSSNLIREQVFIGVKLLLDNSLSHSTLRVLLPNLKNLIHDQSERVRESFADLLLFIKGISTIRFFDIVPVEHLLERMILDYKNQRLSKKFTQLIVELYFPTDAKKWDLVNNCIQFFKTKKQAAFSFYSNLVNFVPVLLVAKFVCTLFNYLVKFSNQNIEINELPISLQINKEKTIDDDNDKENESDDEKDDDDVGVSVEDFESILEIISLILNSLKPLFSKKEEFQKTKSSMLQVFNDDDITSIYIWLFSANIPRIEGMCKIIKIASQFSLENFPTLKELLLQNFKEIDSTTPDLLKETLLLSLFSWELPKQVLKIIINSINLPFKKLFDSSPNNQQQEKQSKRKRESKKNQKKKKKGEEEEEQEEQEEEESEEISFEKTCEKATISIVFLDMLFKNDQSRAQVLNEDEMFGEMISSFQSILPIIVKRLEIECKIKLTNSDSDSDSYDDNDVKEKPERDNQSLNKRVLLKINRNLLVTSFTIYTKILFHSEGLNETIQKDSGYFNDIFDFGKLLIKILQKFTKKQLTNNKRKRKNLEKENGDEDVTDDENDDENDDEDSNNNKEEFVLKDDEKLFITEMLQCYLMVLSESITFGLFSSDSCNQFYLELSKILEIIKGFSLIGFNEIIPVIAKFSTQLINHSLNGGGDPRLQESSQKLLFQLFDNINSCPIIKKNLNNNNNNKPFSFFKLSEYLLLYNQKGLLNVIIKSLVEQQIFKEFSKILNLEPDFQEQLDLLENLDQLLPSCQFIIQTISKSSPCINQIGNFLTSYVNTQSMNQKSIYYSLNVISIIINLNLNSRSIDLSPLTTILINFISQLPSFVSLNEDDEHQSFDKNGDEEDEQLKQLKLSTTSKIKYSSLLSMSNDLFSLCTNDREREKEKEKEEKEREKRKVKQKVTKEKEKEKPVEKKTKSTNKK
ncbi:hypothetical protein RB653_008821 [Dictyostelium firmibasis]|uniref:Uncharacterized protein n=1 Tax=Dictyostelium firmibasis TaxID=79012 RepID=A0AAN7YWW3_9MYCE